MVEPARGRTARKGDRAGIGLDRLDQVFQRLEGAVLGHDDDAGIGTDGADEANLIGGHAGEGVLRKPGRRRGRGGDDQVGVVVPLGHDVVIGDAATGTGHVRDLNRLIDLLEVVKQLADLTAGEVPAATRIGGRDALCRPDGAGRHKADHGAGPQRLEEFERHEVLPDFSCAHDPYRVPDSAVRLQSE